MKKYLLITLFLLTGTFCNGQFQKLIVKTNSESREIRFWPLNGGKLPFYDLSTIVDISSGETTEIILPQGECIYRIRIGDKSFQIYATAGSVDTVYSYGDLLHFAGDNEKYNQFLIKTEESDKYCQDYSISRSHELFEVNNLSDFCRIVDSLKLKDNLFLKDRQFSGQFVRQQQLLTAMRYNALFLKKVQSLYRARELTTDWIDELKNRDFLFSNELSRRSEWFYETIKDYAFSKSLIIEGNSPQDIMNSYHDVLFDNYCRMLSGNNLEYALACLLYDDIFQETYNKDMPPLYSRYLSLFPNSTYTDVLAPGIEKIEDLYSQGDDKKVVMLNYETEPENFEEMIRPFLGKVVYIDIWATWCLPCLKMFSHLDSLKEKVRNMDDVLFFYISLDQDRNAEKWQRMANYYGLQGYHYRVNEQTSKIVHSSLGDSNGMLSIPRYVIVDKNGKIALANAAPPSDAAEVAEQLKTFLK